jgi:hypothetical protein
MRLRKHKTQNEAGRYALKLKEKIKKGKNRKLFGINGG